jgi:hypothetical protein
VAAGVDAVRKRCDLQQRLPRDCRVGVVEQTVHGLAQRRI